MELSVVNKLLLCLGLFCIYTVQMRAQGWSFFGPDSEQWRNVNQIDGSFHEGKPPRLVIATEQGTIAKFGNQWRQVYPVNDFICLPSCAKEIQEVHFSPWNDSIAFVQIYWRPDKYSSISFDRVANTYEETLWQGKRVAFMFFPYPRRASIAFSHHTQAAYIMIAEFDISADEGQTWTEGEFQSEFLDNYFLSTNLSIDSLLYYGAGYSLGVNVSTDRGKSWTPILAMSMSSEFSGAKFLANGNTLVLGTARTWGDNQSGDDCGIYQSTDQGVSWRQELSSTNVFALIRERHHPGCLFAATSRGVYKSYDEGKTWEMYNNTLPTSSLNDLVKDPYSDTLYVATDLGVIKVFDRAVMGVGPDNSVGIPKQFSLKQNYPNPFNPSTTVKYTIPHAGMVKLKLYNLLGIEMQTLVDGFEMAGEHSVSFAAEGISSGVYFYRLQTKDFVETKKMAILR